MEGGGYLFGRECGSVDRLCDSADVDSVEVRLEVVPRNPKAAVVLGGVVQLSFGLSQKQRNKE